jgi:phenylalanyl-tRNA synthetase beta chain
MPVIELNLNRLRTLIGKRIASESLVDTITKLGADVEGSDDKTITVEFFPDRPDLLSVEGTARALRVFIGLEKGLKTYNLLEQKVEMRVEQSIIPIREHIQCLEVKGVNLDGESLRGLMELQEDLHWAIGRDRKKVAIGVHDARNIVPPYLYKAAGPAEVKFEPLGMPGTLMSLGEILEKHPKGVEYANIINRFNKYPLILDSQGSVLSMPPIINGELTKLTEDTIEMFVEVTGTDEKAVKKAMNILASAFAENGWTLSKVNVNYPSKIIITPDLKPENRRLSFRYTNKILGLDLNPEETVACLEKTGYGAKVDGDNISILVPAYRADILHDIDIVEDIAIGYGYENFQPKLPNLSTTGFKLPEDVRSRKARDAMLGLGFTEVVTLMLSNQEVNNVRMGINDDSVKVQNPISGEHTIIRTHLIPSILEVLYLNRHRELPQRIFEVGDILNLDSKQETGSKKEKRLAACIIHHKANFSEAKSIFNSIIRDLNIGEACTPLEHPSFIKGRSAGIKGVGYFGEVHPKVLSSFNLEYPVVALEMLLE